MRNMRQTTTLLGGAIALTVGLVLTLKTAKSPTTVMSQKSSTKTA